MEMMDLDYDVVVDDRRRNSDADRPILRSKAEVRITRKDRAIGATEFEHTSAVRSSMFRIGLSLLGLGFVLKFIAASLEH